jgi:VIT1/CCC1 family predicted Fe2+/Mn2+ transporter
VGRLNQFISSVRSALGGPDPAAALAELASAIRVSADVSFTEDDRLITASELASGAVGDIVAEFAASTSILETERVSVDRRIRANTGGTIENIVEFFPGATVLELHYTGDGGNRPATWTSTLLVVQPLEGGSDGSTWQLVGIAQDGPAS